MQKKSFVGVGWMLVKIKGTFIETTDSELHQYIVSATHEVAGNCIYGIYEAHKDSIVLVDFERFTNIIWMYQKNGVALLMDLPKKENRGFRCDFYNFIGHKSTISWPGKEEGALPF